MKVTLSWIQEGKPMSYEMEYSSSLAAGDLIRYMDLMKRAETEDVRDRI